MCTRIVSFDSVTITGILSEILNLSKNNFFDLWCKIYQNDIMWGGGARNLKHAALNLWNKYFRTVYFMFHPNNGPAGNPPPPSALQVMLSRQAPVPLELERGW